MVQRKRKIILFLVISIIFVYSTVLYVSAQVIDELNDDIKSKKGDIETLEKRLDTYQKKIQETRKESLTLQNHIAVLENEIAKNEVEIEISKKQIENVNLEIRKTNLEMNETQKSIERQKVRIAEFIRLLHKNDQAESLEIFMLNQKFSDFFNHYKYLGEVQGNLQQTVAGLKKIKNELDLQKKSLEEKKLEEISLKEVLENQSKDLDEKLNSKEVVLIAAKQSESTFKNYVNELKQEQRQINSEIVNLEKKLRDEIEKKKQREMFEQFGRPGLMWPTDGRYVTARFHDPDYPYRHIFEHPAIDIRASQGTLVRAAESGYVGKVRFDGTKYAYILLIHNDGISTVYGHVSKILTSQGQFVKKGDVIALSGGQPGSPGSGALTSGAHLHFEVRIDGIPVDPLGKYTSDQNSGQYILPRDW